MTSLVMVPKPTLIWGERAFHNNNGQYVKFCSSTGAGSFNYQEFNFSAYRFRRLSAAVVVHTALSGPSLEVNVYHGAVSGTPVLSVSLPGSATGVFSDEDTGEAIREVGGAISLEFKTTGYTSGTVEWRRLWAEVELEPVP